MNMMFFIIVIITVISLFILVVSSPVEKIQTNEFQDDINLNQMTISADYVGGLKSVLEKTKCSLILMKDKINVRIAFKGVDILIPFNQIVNIERLSGHELEGNKYIGKLLETKNIYLSKRSKKELGKEFIVIAYYNSQEEEQILIFEYASNKDFASNFRKIFNEFINEQYSKNELSIGKVCTADSFN